VAEDLVRAMVAAQSGGRRLEELLLTALLWAGTLEAALADAGAPAAAAAAATTDRIARAYLRRTRDGLVGLAAQISTWPVPARLRVSPPEGFAYYGLSPDDVAHTARSILPEGTAVLVVGIRSIGTTLSAAVLAALEVGGRSVERLTVRPEGPPFDRITRLGDAAGVVARHAEQGSRFLVVDEGPGLSGSSFLSVAEALESAGAPPERIVLLGSRVVDPQSLVARDGAARWARFRVEVARAAAQQGDGSAPGGEDLSGGAWRPVVLGSPRRWPATWPALERYKQRSADGRWLLKFEGLGPFGAAVHARAAALAERGWAPWPSGAPDIRGLVGYPFPAGTPLAAAEADRERVAALGRYCALRHELFPADADPEALEGMARHDVAVEAGLELPAGWSLPCERPAITDGRMLPHEWLRTADGGLVKVDGAAHGDDHLYPGPCDVAWDLAGASVEWALGADARQVLVAAYRAAAGEDPGERLPRYEIAYAAFRAAWCAMAAATAPADEVERLAAARARYRAALRQALERDR
jgi:hypothetical protein